MGDLLKTARLVGLRRLWELYRGYRLGMLGTITGHYTTRTLQALLNVGFFDEMAARGSVDPEAFAEARRLDARILTALCESLFSSRILKKAGAGYALDARGRVLVGGTRGWFEGIYGYEDVFHSLEQLLRKEKEYGKDVNRRMEWVTKGYAETGRWIYFPWLIDLIARRGFAKVLDLGCGDGAFVRALCESRGGVTACGVDIAPEAIAAGREKVEAAGLEGRIDLCVADVAKPEALAAVAGGPDVATILFLLHELLAEGAEVVVDMLRGFRAAFPGVPLMVVEVVRPTPEGMRRRPGMAILYFLYHDLSGQKPVDRAQWRELFRRAGFSSIEESELALLRTVVFTVR